MARERSVWREEGHGCARRLEKTAEGMHVGTYDYSLAFGYTDPEIAMEILGWLGMPSGNCRGRGLR